MKVYSKTFLSFFFIFTFHNNFIQATDTYTQELTADEQGGEASAHKLVNRALLTEVLSDEETIAIYNKKLCTAASNKDYSLVRQLVLAGANVNNTSGTIKWEKYTESNCTPLYIAMAYQDEEMVQLLIVLGAESTIPCCKNSGWCPLSLAVQRNNLEQVKNMLAIDPNAEKFISEQELIYLAIRYADLAMVQLLCESGANLDCFNHEGLTPLMKAASQGKTDIALFIVNKSQIATMKSQQDYMLTNPEAKMIIVVPEGSTALHFACAGQQGETARALFLTKKIPSNLTNSKKKKAKCYAKGETVQFISDVL